MNKKISLGLVLVIVGVIVFSNRKHMLAENHPVLVASAQSSIPQESCMRSDDGSEAQPDRVAFDYVNKAAAPVYKFIDVKMLEGIRDTPDLKERPTMLYDLMSEASLAAVHELLVLSDDSNYSEGFRDAMKVAAYERWYVLDPATAIREAGASLMTQNQKVAQLQAYLDDWSGKSPKEVMSFIKQGVPSGLTEDQVYGAIVRGGASAGDRELIDYAFQRMTDPRYRKYAIQAVAASLRMDHNDLFEDWLASLSVEEQKTAIAESAKFLVDTDIDQAIEELQFLAESEAEQLSVAVSRVVVKWTEKDPKAAAEWVQKFKGKQRETLFANVINVWLLADEDATLDWISSLLKDGVIDEAFLERVAVKM